MTERPTIFVSGVTSEFGTFRQAVRDVLLAKDTFPIVQDSFPPDYRQVCQMLTEHISRSDAVICLVGFAYGAEPRNRPDAEPRRSYAQLEYHIARELNKPVFVFLSDEEVRPCDELPDEDDERGVLQLAHRAAITEGDELWHVFKAKDQLLTLVAEIPIVAQAGFKISSGRLRHGAEHLVGREEALGNLDKAWDDSTTHVVTIVAWGGVGKTALAVEWMARMAKDGWPGAERVLDWSFYSQGTSETTTASSDAFVAKALEFFGDPEMAQSAASPWDKGERLAQLVADRKTLLVLDGVEPLQYPPGPVGGKLKDPGLEALLKGLTQHNAGLCIVTTRESVADLAPFHGTTAREWPLEHLSAEAGAQLLFDAGVKRAGNAEIKADDQELKNAAREVGGHALTLQLLGRYLAKVHNGDVRKRKLVAFHKADAKIQGGHAFRMLAAYEKWLGGAGEEGKRQLAVLRLLGLFDRPADAGCITALRKEPAIEGLTEPLVGLDDDDWNYTLSNLRERALIATHGDDLSPITSHLSLDAHPLVREYFGNQLRKNRPKAWREAHRRLFEHLCASTPDNPQPTLEDLQPLYQAIFHGCQARQFQEALWEVYGKRISRNEQRLSTYHLGAWSTDLAALSGFFSLPWTQTVEELERSRPFLLNLAGFNLWALGRLRQAREPMFAALEVSVDRKDSQGAATVADNLSQISLALGEINAAVAYGHQGVEFARSSAHPSAMIISTCTLADALHQAGDFDGAEGLFREAENWQHILMADSGYLYSYCGFWFCDLLLSRGDYQEVQKRARQTLRGVSDLLSVGLDHLSLGRAALLQVLNKHISECSSERIRMFRLAAHHLHEAVKRLRASGSQPELVQGLLGQATLHRASGNWGKAWHCLEEAQEIAGRSEMRLALADFHLEAARLSSAEAMKEQARKHMLLAENMINEMGYGRRKVELEELRKQVENE